MNIPRIMLVEDSESDYELTRRAFIKGKLKVELIWIQDGKAALDYFKEDHHGHHIDLILLDLNLPKISGLKVLEELKSNPITAPIPISVLTTSAADEDILESYAKYANCYIQKPITMEGFEHVIRTLEDFWFTIVKIPGQTTPI